MTTPPTPPIPPTPITPSITATTLYRRRGMHRQRDLDFHYVIPASALLAYAIATAVHDQPPSTPDTFSFPTSPGATLVFSTYLPLLCFWAAWNDTRQIVAGRVRFWSDPSWWVRNLPGAVPLIPVGTLTLAFGAVPAFAASAILRTAATDTAHIATTLWRCALLTLLVTLIYTVLGTAFATTSARAYGWGIAYVLGFELLLSPYADVFAWFSPGAWARAAAFVPSSPLPAASGWGLLLIVGGLAVLWAAATLMHHHREQYPQWHRASADLDATFGPPDGPDPDTGDPEEKA